MDGLYTRTLFRYDRQFLERLSPALELGRSFVRPEYQRNHAALLLLWRGIGRFVALHPEYRVLFGPVSISARYADASHQLLRASLEQNCLDVSLGRLVTALDPPRGYASREVTLPRSIEEADRLVSALEADGKGMPVLLRQYLKLGARLIGFNVDRAFGDALDALMMVDLAVVDRGILGRYMGREEAAAFQARHGASRAA
jgi:putative hemolysin